MTNYCLDSLDHSKFLLNYYRVFDHSKFLLNYCLDSLKSTTTLNFY